MRNALKSLLFAAFLLLPGTAFAQCTFTAPIAANAVVGRLGNGPGPCQVIPFTLLSTKLTGVQTTLNSGNGQTAPGAMAPGNTYTFGATTDTPQFAGIGLGGTAPATGLKVYNAPVTPGTNGQGVIGSDTVNGGVLGGQGVNYDASLYNKNGVQALGVATGTQNVFFTGAMTAPSLTTSGTIAGSVCMKSDGTFLYEVAVNCFAVSGITVVSGKTLTVDNTIELAGTDGTKFTFPGANDTVETLAATQTISGTKTFSGTLNITGTGQINGTAFGTFATQNFATPPAIGGTTPNTGAFSTLTATTPVGLSSGGTNASSAAGARASGGLNVDGYTPKGDTNYTILATDRTVGTSGSLTAPRTWTLPAASAVNAGQELVIADMAGGATNTNTITISRAGSDTINGGTSVAISVTNGAYLLKSDGISKWTAQQLGAQATVGVSSINGQTGNPSIVAGAAISVNTSGGNISVANTGVTSWNGLTGAVTSVVPPQGRLTLASHTPVMLASQTTQGILYYDSFVGNQVPYFTGTADAVDTIPSNEVSDAMATSGTGVLNAADVFDVWWEGNTHHNICIATNGSGGGWIGDTGGSLTARGSSYSALDFTTRPYTTNANSVSHCYNAATDYGGITANKLTYLGTCATDAASAGKMSFTLGTTAANGGGARIACWNAANRVPFKTLVADNTASWTYAASPANTFREAHGSTTFSVSQVFGVSQDPVVASYTDIATPGASTAVIAGIGVDSTTVFCDTTGYLTTNTGQSTARCKTVPGVGLHAINALESASTTTSSTHFGWLSGNYGTGLIYEGNY